MTKYKDTLTGFMVVVIAISLVNIFTGLDNINLYRMIHSALGLLAGALFFTRRDLYKPVTLVWLFIQIPVISRNFFDRDSGIFFTQKIWDLTLNYSFSFGFHIDAVKIDFDILSVFLIILFIRTLKQSKKEEKEFEVEAVSETK